MHFGIRANLGQFLQQLLQVLLVGLTIGMMRNVVPALAESEFGVPRGSFMLLVAFVVAFGFVKGAMNFIAGRLAEQMGRKRVLLLGWLVALPIPPLVYFATSWSWVVFATILLGINQGLTWSMTQTAKLDITRADQRGLVIGLNEFSGYVGVAFAGVVTGYLASMLGPRQGLLWFGSMVIGLATILAWLSVAETLPWARDEVRRHAMPAAQALRPKYPTVVGAQPTTAEMFALMTWRDRRMAALSQAGMVEKFVDALVWVFWPIYLHQHGVGLPGIGWIVGVYGFTWGAAQFFTGISPVELAEMMKTRPVALIDTRDAANFAEAHLPGAVNIHEIFTYLATSTPQGVAALRNTFAEAFGKAGLSGKETAVVYEQSMTTGFGQSCRGYVLLRYLGYPRYKIKVLHGGFGAWRAAALPSATDTPAPKPVKFPLATEGSRILVGVEEMKEAVADPHVVKLDVRDVDEWIGESSSPYGKDFCPRKGRIPGSIWLEWYRMMKPTHTGQMFKSPAEILAECATVGIRQDTPVIVFCFKGARASNTFVALEEAGIKDVRLYLGSWNEWSRDPLLPIEEGLPY